MAGAQDSFCKVAERLLYKLTGLRLSESTVERTTEAAGKRLEAGTVFSPAAPTPAPIAILGNGADAAKNAPAAPPSAPWKWHRDATGKRCAYVSIDSTGIMMQGPNGAKADGRMVYLAMVYNPRPRTSDDTTPCADVRYLAGLNKRLSMGGMRWGEAGGDSVAHLRALFCSEERQWDAFWAMAA